MKRHAEPFFWTDREGRVLYCPRMSRGDAYVVPDAETRRSIETKLAKLNSGINFASAAVLALVLGLVGLNQLRPEWGRPLFTAIVVVGICFFALIAATPRLRQGYAAGLIRFDDAQLTGDAPQRPLYSKARQYRGALLILPLPLAALFAAAFAAEAGRITQNQALGAIIATCVVSLGLVFYLRTFRCDVCRAIFGSRAAEPPAGYRPPLRYRGYRLRLGEQVRCSNCGSEFSLIPAAPRRAAFSVMRVWALLGALGLAAGVAYIQLTSGPPEEATRAGRVVARTPVAVLALAPLPNGIPLRGDVGRDMYGYPRQYVDRAALRSLLWHEKYRELEAAFDYFQEQFETDARNEYWPLDAAWAFRSAEPELGKRLDAWVAASPKSFAPYVARGSYYSRVGNVLSGTRAASAEDAEQRNREIAAAFKAASADFSKALSLRPRAAAAHAGKARMFPDTRDVIASALESCPSCYEVRALHLALLAPRWDGGSHEAMQKVAAAAAGQSNSRLRVLAGFVDWDKAETLRSQGNLQQALAAIDRALSFGEDWRFLRERALIKDRLNDLNGAFTDIERAVALRPGEPELLAARSYAHRRLARHEASARDVFAVLQVDPTNDYIRSTFDSAIKGLVYSGWEHSQAGRHDDALRAFDLAFDLAPRDQEMQRQAWWAVLRSAPAGETVETLAEYVRRNPADYRAVERLDYRLLESRDYQRIAEIWSAYIAQRPQDGRAYFHRGGVYRHVGTAADVMSDWSRACALGASGACARLNEIPAPTGKQGSSK